MQLSFAIELIPDGASSIVRLHITSEFNVPTDGGAKLAEDVVVKIAQRLTCEPEHVIRSGIADQFWLGDMDRPSEALPP